ncbi:MAG TPA: sigma-70 family RNA polymerase sigma factor [Verrucomicrobiae bacterium]|nr:sigma-70 family RNA polymerase sigma factor [Verrucomicrobiae bacterium]
MSFSTPSPEDRHSGFSSTHWSVVLQSGQADSPQAAAALAKLCHAYWYPLYLFVRRTGHNAEDAQDLTQAFFERLMEKRYLAAADPEKGKFRSFLLTALKRFLANEWDRATRQKRGGGQQILSLNTQDSETRYLAEPADVMTPAKLYERRWALTLLEQVITRLESEMVAAGKARIFEELKIFLTGEKSERPYAQIAETLQMTEATLKVTVHRLRQRYGELLRLEIAHTVADPKEIDEEIRHLFAALS